MNWSCREVQPRLDTFIDGELSPEHTLLTEAHLEQCEQCQEHVFFASSLKTSVHKVAFEDAEVSPAFEAQLRKAIRAERDAEQVKAAPKYFEFQRPNWQTVAGAILATAAGIVLLLRLGGTDISPEATADGFSADLGTGRHFQSAPSKAMGKSNSALSSSAPVAAGSASFVAATHTPAMRSILDRLLEHHSSRRSPHVTQEESLVRFEPVVGLRLQVPHLRGARWEGASLVAVSDHQTVHLSFRTPKERIAVYVYNPYEVQMHRMLQRRDQGLYTGKYRGYKFVAREVQGVGYIVAGEDEQNLMQLASAIH